MFLVAFRLHYICFLNIQILLKKHHKKKLSTYNPIVCQKLSTYNPIVCFWLYYSNHIENKNKHSHTPIKTYHIPKQFQPTKHNPILSNQCYPYAILPTNTSTLIMGFYNHKQAVSSYNNNSRTCTNNKKQHMQHKY